MDWRTCVLICFSAFLDATSSSQIDCFLDEQECQIEADNQIDFFTDVPTSEECAQLCNDDRTCTAFTHFGPASYPLHEACILFSSCRERRPCVDCTTGSNQAVCTCYGPQDKVNPNVCFLLNKAGLQNPVKVCDNCTSGPAQCNTNAECQVAVFAYKVDNNYNYMTNLVLFVLGEESFELSFEARETGCYINTTFLAIGGGGRGYSYNGGGCGFIEIGRQLLFSNSSVHVYAGDSGARSLVQVDGDTLIEAASGGS